MPELLRRCARNDRASATLRAIVFVVPLFAALVCGLLAGMSLAAVLYRAERGVMDSTY
jgi:hypothetical protein